MMFHIANFLNENNTQQYYASACEISKIYNPKHLSKLLCGHPHGLALNDRASNYGDGCFTTMYAQSSHISLFRQHMQRLVSDAKRLSIEIDVVALEHTVNIFAKHFLVNSECDSKASSEPTSNISSAIKIVLSRGCGGRGYELPAVATTQVVISFHPCVNQCFPLLAKNIDKYQVQVANIKLASQTLLAGIKHLNRLEQVLAKRELQTNKSQDLILCDQNNVMIEASAANIFYCKEEKWFTPFIESSGVNGVMRNVILEYFDISHIPYCEINAQAESLQYANSVFVCNAVKQIVPVTHFLYEGVCYKFDINPVLSLANELAQYTSKFDHAL